MRREAERVEEKSGGVAAFFDLDGTLVPLPSLEKRFFAMLRYRQLIGIENYFLWIAEAVRMTQRGINRILHANKMYMRGVSVEDQKSLRLPTFYPKAIERITWHAQRGHRIVLLSGTLEPLAERAARALERELCVRGMAGAIRVCATRLEEGDGRWTGRIAGVAIFGEAKARAIRRIAAEADLDLEQCYAYGDSANDRWMLEVIGKPAAVNPSQDLARIAGRYAWPVLWWTEEERPVQRTRSSQKTPRKSEPQTARMTAKDSA